MNKKEYRKYLKSKWWKNFKKEYFKRYEKRCAECESIKNIHLHHVNYSRLGCEEFTDVVALCRFCHAIEHGRLESLIRNVKKKRKRKPFKRKKDYDLRWPKEKYPKSKIPKVEIHVSSSHASPSSILDLYLDN